MIGLDGKTAIVTGASRGIGRAIVLELARHKVNVAYNYTKDEASAAQLAQEVELLGVCALPMKASVRSDQDVQKFVEAVHGKFGGIDFLVNNAGILADKPLFLMNKSDWDDVIDTNLSGAYRVTRAVITGMLKKKSGSIVNISSTAGLVGNVGQTNYSASKAGLIGFSKALAKETAGHGVRVNVVAPGFIDTDMIKSIPRNKLDDAIKAIPMKRIGSASEVARVVIFLLSDSASYVSGHVFPVDGGLAI